MLNKFKYTLLLFSLSLLAPACERALLGDDPAPDPLTVFDALWEDVDARYSFFTEKDIDWDSVRTVFRPQVTEDMDELALFDLLADMLFLLRDGHVNITTTFDRSRNWEWYLNFPPNFDENIVERTYLGQDSRLIGPFRTQLIDDILYVYYGSFANTIEEAHLDALMDRAADAHGLIFDIRHNGGGSLSNARRIAGCLTDESRLYALERIKTGPGPGDFSGWEELYISPRDGSRYSGPVVVLTNRHSYSAANAFAQMARVLPNVTLMGDRSGGGGGTPVFGELPNGWTYRFSATQTKSPDNEQLEFGIPVDVEVSLLPDDELNNTDTIIEAALDFF